MRLAVIAAVLVTLGSTGPALAGSPTASVSLTSTPAQAALAPAAGSELAGVTVPNAPTGLSWYDAGDQSAQTINCIGQYQEPLGTSYVGWLGDLSNPWPVNTIYYVHVWWAITGNPCTGGARVAPEIFLPSGTTLAISNLNPVKCYAATIPPPNQQWSWSQETTSCPQSPRVGQRGGLAFYPTGQSTWPTARGTAWDIQIPVLSTAKLSGLITAQPPQVCPSCLVAAVWMIDGVASPWEYPVQGIPISGPTTPTITYPTPSATNVTTTTASGNATLDRAGTTGYVYVEFSGTPPGGSTCVQNSNQFQIGASSPNVVPLLVSWSGLTPGTTYYWRLCYVTNGMTYWGTNQTFTTQGTPPPKIIALTPGIGLPDSQFTKTVTVSGSGLNGATDVKLAGTSVPFTPDQADPAHLLKVTLPSGAQTGFVTVTTPIGTATSPQKFVVGLETFIDSATVADYDGDGQADDVRVAYHASEPDPFAQYECFLDPDPNDPAVGLSCDAGVYFKYNLSPGTHTLNVVAKFNGLRDPTPASATFTYSTGDTTPPDTAIASGPADQSWVSSTQVTFSFTSTETGSTFECRTTSTQIWTSCASPTTYSGLSQGWHYFYVRARDASNNADPTPEVRSYDVDTVPPDTLVWTGPAQGSYVASTSATFAYLAINGSSRFDCKLDAMAFAPCPQPTTYTGLAQGAHTFSVRALDNAGNVDPTPATRTWTVDTVSPVPQPPTATPGISTQTPVTGTQAPVRLRWPAATDASGIQRYDVLQSINAGSYSVIASVGGATLTTVRQLSPASVYRFRIRAVDKAGNMASSANCAPFSVVVYQETASEVSYGQAWSSSASASAWGGSRKVSSAAGATASLNAPAGTTAVAWVGTLESSGGQANVYLDGVKVATINLNAITSTPRRVLYSRTGLNPLVAHVLKVERAATSAVGSTIDVDGFFALR